MIVASFGRSDGRMRRNKLSRQLEFSFPWKLKLQALMTPLEHHMAIKRVEFISIFPSDGLDTNKTTAVVEAHHNQFSGRFRAHESQLILIGRPKRCMKSPLPPRKPDSIGVWPSEMLTFGCVWCDAKKIVFRCHRKQKQRKSADESTNFREEFTVILVLRRDFGFGANKFLSLSTRFASISLE
jgi:hypothetical protein